MGNIECINVAIGTFDDEKITLLEAMPNADTLITIWFKLLILAGKQKHGGVIELSEYMPMTIDMLSTLLSRPRDAVQDAIDIFVEYGMVSTPNGQIVIKKWNKYQNSSPARTTADTYDVDEAFNAIWALYPRKEGKSAIKKKARKRICDIGIEEMTRAIARYSATIVGKDSQYVLMGSTFFNTRYADFLDSEFPSFSQETNNDEEVADY